MIILAFLKKLVSARARLSRRVVHAEQHDRRESSRKGEALSVRVAPGTVSPLDYLLAPVDIVRCSGDGCVRHEEDGKGGDVGRADHSADWQSGAQLLATRV